MGVSPIEYRYGRPEVKKIFSEGQRLAYMLTVERAIAQAESEYGLIPEEAFREISDAVDSHSVTVERVKEIEKEINHDTMAMVRALTEKCRNGGKYVHYGVTSNDIVDTSTALQLRDFYEILADGLFSLQGTLQELVSKYIDAPMLGRTHGQWASPITFGLKMAVFLTEINRHIQRLAESRSRVLVGKILGPVGTGASIGEKAIEVQGRAMEILGIYPEDGATQIVDRDRYVEYLSVLNGVATSLEKFGTEIRNLQRPEIAEVSEFFDSERQVGSSAMPSKRNPISSENVCSISRFVRSMIIPEYEAAVTWHERDLTNSALERFTIPYSSILIDYAIHRMDSVFRNLFVNTEGMLKNLYRDQTVMSESVVSALVKGGMARQDAHELVRKASMESYRKDQELKKSLTELDALKFIGPKELEAALDPRNFLGVSQKICESALQASFALKKSYKGGAHGRRL